MRTSAKDKKILAHLFSDLLGSVKSRMTPDELEEMEERIILLCTYCHVKPETVTGYSFHYFVDNCTCKQEVRKSDGQCI